MLMEARFDHSSAVTSEGIYIIGAKSGTRGFGTKLGCSVEHFLIWKKENLDYRIVNLQIKLPIKTSNSNFQLKHIIS